MSANIKNASCFYTQHMYKIDKGKNRTVSVETHTYGFDYNYFLK